MHHAKGKHFYYLFTLYKIFMDTAGKIGRLHKDVLSGEIT